MFSLYPKAESRTRSLSPRLSSSQDTATVPAPLSWLKHLYPPALSPPQACQARLETSAPAQRTSQTEGADVAVIPLCMVISALSILVPLGPCDRGRVCLGLHHSEMGGESPCRCWASLLVDTKGHLCCRAGGLMILTSTHIPVHLWNRPCSWDDELVQHRPSYPPWNPTWQPPSALGLCRLTYLNLGDPHPPPPLCRFR